MSEWICKLDEFIERQGVKSAELCKIVDGIEKEIASLKAQLKEAEFIAELGNCISEQGRAYAKAKGVPFKNCAEAVLIDRWKIYRENVRARGQVNES